jgi:hypothetical protein
VKREEPGTPTNEGDQCPHETKNLQIGFKKKIHFFLMGTNESCSVSVTSVDIKKLLSQRGS